MSRGLGRRQREILAALDEPDVGVIVTDSDETAAEQVAFRRAAYKLEAAGLITLVSERIEGRPRLVAYRAGAEVPPTRVVTGMDGKPYRQPHLTFSVPD